MLKTRLASLALVLALGLLPSRPAFAQEPDPEPAQQEGLEEEAQAGEPEAPPAEEGDEAPEEEPGQEAAQAGQPPSPAEQAAPAGSGSEGREDATRYKVVVNHEEQYSIWPEARENALGWRDAGKSGTKEECLAYIKEVWTDMRPLSLRKKMEEAQPQP